MLTTQQGLGRLFLRPAAINFSIGMVLTGAAAPARAALYGYAVQQTSNYTLTGATVGTLSANTSSSASQNASPSGFDSHVGTLDALESYVGPAAGKPPENTFTPKGQTTPDYSRGDALVIPAQLTTNNVAELFLSDVGNATGSGAWAVSAPLTLTAPGAVSLSFSFTNDLTVTHTGSPPGTVQASYAYNYNIQDSSGNVVFSSSPTATNKAVSLIAAGSVNIPGAGTVTITSGTLSAGTYTMTLTGSENVFANATPEPASCLLLGIGLIGLRRRNRGM